jgi:hypothetical protein
MKQTNEEGIDFEALGDGDFVFIVDESGHLKSVLVPEDFEGFTNETPTTVQKIFKIFGIKQLNNQTLH